MGVPTRKSRRFRLAALGIIFLTIAIRLPSLVHPQPIDSEAMYSVVANEIVDGGRPYVDEAQAATSLLDVRCSVQSSRQVQLESASVQPENPPVPSEELSDSHQTSEGTVPAGRAHRRGYNLSDALGLAQLAGVASLTGGFPSVG